ncbi:MAG: Hsp70 family protein [Pseudonocardiaceae bacterium]|nr:Hsp70 family protein [Pseudonocardiaceae bacterium]
MPYVLGVDLGHTRTTAAVCRRIDGFWRDPEVVPLEGDARWMESTLQVSLDGSVLVGQAAAYGSPASSRTVRGLLRRVGDPVPLVVGEHAYPAEVLAAAMVGWVADVVTSAHGGQPEQIVLNHPPCWGQHRKRALYEALEAAGLPGVLLLPTPVAAAENHLVAEPVEAGAVLAVCRLGGEHVESAILRRVAAGFELMDSATSAEPQAGALIDDLLVDHVQAKINGELPDPNGLAALRLGCAWAKEQLSVESAVRLAVPHAGEVHLSRREFEHLARGVLEAATAQLRRIASRVPEDQLTAALLVGGSARIPLLAVLAEAALHRHGSGCRVLVDPDPGSALCRGAALVARRRIAPDQEPGYTTVLPQTAQPMDAIENQPNEVAEQEIGPPPPRPPVEITPLEPPRRFASLRRGSRGDDGDEDSR